MVELVDTQDLESCEETRTGSIPAIRTIRLILVLILCINTRGHKLAPILVLF